MKHFFSILLIGCLVAACSNEDNDTAYYCEQSAQWANHGVSVEQITAEAVSFVSKLNNQTRSTNGSSLKVENVQAISFPSHATRSSGETVNLDSLLYIINFADSCGFVIAGEEDYAAKIYAYIESGNYSWNETDSLNPGFAAFIYGLLESKSKDAANATCEDDLLAVGGGGPGDGSLPPGSGFKPAKFEVMYPLLNTKWGQLDPYNLYVPNSRYTGCVATAVSQICSYLKSPSTIQWNDNGMSGSLHIDWNQINMDCSNHGGTPYSSNSIDQIARLMRYWGLVFDADYGEGGTDINSEYALTQMWNFGFNVTGLSDYNAENVVNDLKAGNKIVYMRGNGRYYHVWVVVRKYVDGHAWVVDGYIDEVKMGDESIYLHCNWGWNGGSNGYYLSDAFNSEDGPAYDDNVTRSFSYGYNLETATFSK